MNPIQLPPAHIDAVNRPRRIIVEYDAFDPHQALGADIEFLRGVFTNWWGEIQRALSPPRPNRSF